MSATSAATAADRDIVIDLRDVETRFGAHVVHQKLCLQVRRAEVFAIIGGSGSGKSTLLREMILLHRPDAGSIKVLGVELNDLSPEAALDLRLRWGVLFQHGGLFGSLTVLENIGLPLREHTRLGNKLIDEIAAWKLHMTGLKPEVGAQYPAQLSGGMMKRASLARALALDPELLFLDEPTAGLDPESAAGVDELVLRLRDLFGLTIVMISHDLDLLWQVADRVAVLGEGRVQGVGAMAELARMDKPAIRPFFEGARGRAAQPQSFPPSQTKEPSSKPK
ncbi:MAG: ATP-binding cassette domain-containing protein [Rhodoferax sp.]|jgi:phospholipid/cholesterol/gamma-HCH transport system ATP-binding protein|uniref:ABC transporter ATP-binding protein n=1 Tax=Rhodoferax sp. TaxID=50421 RepID=UPI00273128E3|nr:ATP-binding cassette domain-containing protein [Rhodoferax sp.]MDP1530207.1 ATP-binding cassette domain-containing protein [Rhodoferax sp.]MDP1943447.1 ATP-binding cassette domain-containing protein [Rhodoferax sp.]